MTDANDVLKDHGCIAKSNAAYLLEFAVLSSDNAFLPLNLILM